MEAVCNSLRGTLLRYCIRRSSVLPLNFSKRRSSTYHNEAIKNGMKRCSVKNGDRKDGYHISSRNVFWEERMRSIPKPPLWIEDSNGSPMLPTTKTSNKSLTSTEKRIAATAAITMIIAVIAFKMVFGGKGQEVKENGDTGISATA